MQCKKNKTMTTGFEPVLPKELDIPLRVDLIEKFRVQRVNLSAKSPVYEGISCAI